MNGFTQYPAIDGFSRVCQTQDDHINKVTIRYGGKIKLDGVGAAVRITADNEVVAQGKYGDIETYYEDDWGFKEWVDLTAGAWAWEESSAKHMDKDVIYYGEWAGRDIGTGAVSQLDDRYFFVFAVQEADKIIVAPDAIEEMIPDLDHVMVLPWDMAFDSPVDFAQADDCRSFRELLSDKVERIHQQDPFIYGIFGVEGPGLGWVFTPMCNPGQDPTTTAYVDRYWYEAMSFKVTQ